MCILCGEMVMNVHWTDQPLHNKAYRSKRTVVAGENQRERLRLRLRRVAIADKILKYYGIRIQDWNGSRYMLFSKTGIGKVVYDLGTMWQVAADMCHRTLDPLDPDFLAAMRGEGAQ